MLSYFVSLLVSYMQFGVKIVRAYPVANEDVANEYGV